MSRKHPLDGGDDDSSSSQKKQHIAPPSPPLVAPAPPPPPAVSRLYANVLHCIFAFLPLSQLCVVVRLSKSWCSAVRSVGPASVGGACIAHSTTSLARFFLALRLHQRTLPSPPAGVALHVTQCKGVLTLAEHELHWLRLLPNLRILQARLPSPPWPIPPPPAAADFFLPLRLRELELYDDDPDAERTNPLLTAVAAQLPELRKFRLLLRRVDHCEPFSRINFALLYSAPKLTDFWVNFPEERTTATDQQVADLRALPLQLILPCDPDQNPTLTARLLQPPHTLRYECIARDAEVGLERPSGAELCSHLRYLPSLTVLNACLVKAADKQLDFLTPLVNLTELNLQDTASRGLSAAALLLPSLLGMTRLTSLTLRCSSLSSNHLAQLLPHLPLLKQLTLDDCEQLRSPHFLSSAPSLSKTLTQLQLLACPIAPDPAHFSTLHALTHLVVGCKNTVMLNAAETAEWRHFNPPSRILPNLREFEFVVILPSGEWLRSFKLA